MDCYLLREDLARFAEPLQFQRLNAFERLLLAHAVPVRAGGAGAGRRELRTARRPCWAASVDCWMTCWTCSRTIPRRPCGGTCGALPEPSAHARTRCLWTHSFRTALQIKSLNAADAEPDEPLVAAAAAAPAMPPPPPPASAPRPMAMKAMMAAMPPARAARAMAKEEVRARSCSALQCATCARRPGK